MLDPDTAARRFVEHNPHDCAGPEPLVHEVAGGLYAAGGYVRPTAYTAGENANDIGLDHPHMFANDNASPVATATRRGEFREGDLVNLLGGKEVFTYDRPHPRLSGNSHVLDANGSQLTFWTHNLRLVERPRRGDWMQTYSGRQFWPLDPRADEVHIEDIAHALAMQCRYAGHCMRFYSVAEHSVHLARHFSYDAGLAMWALLHDASEAYLVDVPRPVKPFLPGYKDAECAVQAAVCDAFGLPHEMPAAVHAADSAIIGDERVNMAACVAEWSGNYGGLGVQLEYWTPEEAETEFLAAFWALDAMWREAA